MAVVVLQEVKAEALGPRHSTAALSSIAADPWLSIVRNDAGKGAEAGWFWQYKLNSIKVRSHSFHRGPLLTELMLLTALCSRFWLQ